MHMCPYTSKFLLSIKLIESNVTTGNILKCMEVYNETENANSNRLFIVDKRMSCRIMMTNDFLLWFWISLKAFKVRDLFVLKVSTTISLLIISKKRSLHFAWWCYLNRMICAGSNYTCTANMSWKRANNR